MCHVSTGLFTVCRLYVQWDNMSTYAHTGDELLQRTTAQEATAPVICQTVNIIGHEESCITVVCLSEVQTNTKNKSGICFVCCPWLTSSWAALDSDFSAVPHFNIGCFIDLYRQIYRYIDTHLLMYEIKIMQDNKQPCNQPSVPDEYKCSVCLRVADLFEWSVVML